MHCVERRRVTLNSERNVVCRGVCQRQRAAGILRSLTSHEEGNSIVRIELERSGVLNSRTAVSHSLCCINGQGVQTTLKCVARNTCRSNTSNTYKYMMLYKKIYIYSPAFGPTACRDPLSNSFCLAVKKILRTYIGTSRRRNGNPRAMANIPLATFGRSNGAP